MARKTDDALLKDGDGVSVAVAGKDYEVQFDFSNTLLSKIKAVPGAAFDDKKNAWHVPGSSRAALEAAVEDMRDFRRQGGVQVKDFAKGPLEGKVVMFDYDKTLTRMIGPVAGAAFSQEAGGWVVPKDSPALGAEAGQASFFDRTINGMRGAILEMAKEYEAIKELSVGTAQERGYKPGIHHPQAEHSYTGKIIHANGHWAAQLSGVDEKQGVAYITMHKQGELGKEGHEVLKGDELRIDYGKRREVTNVRTTEVFRAQQAERDSMKTLAESKMEGAKILHASTRDEQEYSGRVVEVGQHFALQHSGRDKFVIHDLSKLKGEVAKDQMLDVKYNKFGIGVVAGPEKGQSQSVAR